jgi:hypothetical protein
MQAVQMTELKKLKAFGPPNYLFLAPPLPMNPKYVRDGEHTDSQDRGGKDQPYGGAGSPRARRRGSSMSSDDGRRAATALEQSTEAEERETEQGEEAVTSEGFGNRG